MTKRLTDERLQAIRERHEAVKATTQQVRDARRALEEDDIAARKYGALINAEFERDNARRYAEAFLDEDIEALLAHIDALKSEIELLRAELSNRPTDGTKPANVWPDRW